MNTPETFETTFGEWVAALHDAFLEEYGDEELANLATATWLQERFLDDLVPMPRESEAA